MAPRVESHQEGRGIRPGARPPGPSVRDVGDGSGALVAQDPGDSGENLHTSNYRCKTWVLSRLDVLPLP